MSTRPVRSSIHAYAALETGVHGIPIEQAVERVRSGGSGAAAAEHPLPVWIDVSKPGEVEAAFLRDKLGFHPLAVEDCIRGRQRAKLERYPEYFFLVFYAAAINPERDRVALNEIHIFLGKNFIVTVHDERVREVAEIVTRWRAAPAYYQDVAALAHALLDSLVDDYFPVLNHFAERAERIENAVFEESDEGIMQQILTLRRELVLFRRVVAPQRDVLSTLVRRDLPFVRPEMFPYFQDVHDHTIRVTEEIDAIRDLLAASLDAQMSAASHHLNQTVRVMTAWTIILMSVTLVAGIYGMNFAYMPELTWRWGYFGALGFMVLVGAVLLVFFRRIRWL